jgi:hypothetical protein
LSPTPAEKPSVRVRPASASPTGLRLPKPQVRLKGWRGPLPPRRITPPAVFADFIEAAVKRTAGRSAEAFIEDRGSRPRFSSRRRWRRRARIARVLVSKPTRRDRRLARSGPDSDAP